MSNLVSRSSFLVGLLLVLLACKALGKDESSSSASAKPAAAAAPAATTSAAGSADDKDKPKTVLTGPKDAKGVDLAKLLGTKADGWTVPPFAKLKEDMTPAEAGKVLPGAEKVDEFGFSEIKKSDVKGVAMYKLSFLDKKLKFATIMFDPALTAEPFWVALASHLKDKLNADMTDHGDHHINWVGPQMNLWSLSKGITHEGYELQIALTK